ncbi:MAG: ABC transporter permease subunit [Pseudomonadota bacterium]
MNYNWNWGIFLAAEPGGTGTYLKYLLVGLGWTLATALAAWVLALAIGAAVGTLRTTPMPWVVRLGNAYVEVFRNVPLIVQMFLWYFVLPELLPKGAGDWVKQMPPPWGSYVPAALCLGIYNSSVALTIGLLELTGRAKAMQEFSFQVFEAFAAATVLYLLTNLVVVLGMRRLVARVRAPGFIGAAPAAGAH